MILHGKVPIGTRAIPWVAFSKMLSDGAGRLGVQLRRERVLLWPLLDASLAAIGIAGRSPDKHHKALQFLPKRLRMRPA